MAGLVWPGPPGLRDRHHVMGAKQPAAPSWLEDAGTGLGRTGAVMVVVLTSHECTRTGQQRKYLSVVRWDGGFVVTQASPVVRGTWYLQVSE
jgi:hypothetical protein